MSCWRFSVLEDDGILLIRDFYLQSEHVLSEVVPVLEDDGILLVKNFISTLRMTISFQRSSPFLNMMASYLPEVYYLEGEHILSEIVPILEE
jgi:hypothetical protein